MANGKNVSDEPDKLPPAASDESPEALSDGQLDDAAGGLLTWDGGGGNGGGGGPVVPPKHR